MTIIRILLSVVILSFCSHAESKATSKKQTICLNMIVKNESHVIKRCLESAKPLIDYWVIVDTGSTDGTQEIIKEYMKNIPGKLYERPWVNFAHNRNEALEYAKNTADYLLFIDADEEFVLSDRFTMPKLDKDFYYITTDFSEMNYARVLLVNNKMDWEWIGVVHEYLHAPNIQSFDTLKGIRNLVHSEGARSKDPNKFIKDAALLEAALKEDPKNTRNQFYLAQSYRDAGKFELAIEHYKKRAEMGGWAQEVFWAKYQVGCLLEAIKAPQDQIIQSYTEAFYFRPTRAEPLYNLAKYFRENGNPLFAYLVSSYALKIPVPSDVLFIENWMYTYGILMEKSLAAYWMGKYDEALLDSHQLLGQKNLPENVKECVKDNLKWINAKFTPAEKK